MRRALLSALIFALPSVLVAQGLQSSTNQSAAAAPAGPTDDQIRAATKAIADANQVLSNAKSLEVQTNTLINKWKSLPDTPASTAQAVLTLEGIYPAVSDAAEGSGLRAKFTSMSDSLKTQSDTVTSKQKDLLVGGSTVPIDDVKGLFNQCDQVSKAAIAEKTALDNLLASLTDPLQRNYAFFTASFGAIHSSLGDLLDFKNQPDPLNAETVRQVLASQLSGFATQHDDYPKLSAEWTKFKPRLSTFFLPTDDPAKHAAPVDTASDQAKTDFNSIPPKFCSWFAVLTKAGFDQTNTLNSDKAKLTADYAGSYDAAVADDAKGKNLLVSLKKISEAWDKIYANPPAFPPSGCKLEDAAAALKNLRDGIPTLSAALVAVEDILSGNRGTWVADQVRLYYFTDVQRLLEILNPNVTQEGGTSDAADKAAAARKDLLNADLSLSDAQAEVNKYQNQLLNLQEQLRQAQAQQKSTSFLFGKTSSLVNRLTDRLDVAQKDATQKSADLNSSDPLKKAAAEQAKNKADSITSQLGTAKQANDNAQKDRDAAQQNLETLQDQQQGLPAQIKAAQAALEAAQATVNRLRNAAIVATQDESDAFAAARDHAPHLKTTAIPGSSDPAHRVEIFGFTDSFTIFIRGAKADVGKVKQIINEFDQPAPQARITLWSLQLNSAGDRKNASTIRFNHALQQVETELSNNRALVAASLSLLRDAINKQVNSTTDCNDAPVKPKMTVDEAARIQRMYCFYNEQVLNALGLRPDNRDFATISKWTLPDPAGTTTLGESLMILSLGKRCLREQAWADFSTKLHQRLKSLNLPPTCRSGDEGCPPPHFPFQADEDTFSLTTRVLNLDDDSAEDGLTPAQLEIVHGLESWGLRRIIDRAEFLFAQLQGVSAGLDAANQQLDSQLQPLIAARQQLDQALKANESDFASKLGTLEKQLQRAEKAKNKNTVAQLNKRKLKLEEGRDAARASFQGQLDALAAKLQASRDSGAHLTRPLETRKRTLNKEIAPLADYLFQRAHISFEELAAYHEARVKAVIGGAPDQAAAFAQLAGQAVEQAKRSDSFLESKARVAAADEMLKEMMIAVEDDLDRLFVHPMTVRLRDDLVKIPSLNVGVLQKTSLLATNRLVARVDPRASAQLGLGQETDILQSLLQLGEVFVAAKMGGPLGALNALNAQKREAPPEIYSLNTGSQFKVTPIFDPSGQALRFKFDYVSGTRIQEPNGTTNPQLPRIERHTVNTEVQISNMEMREISRFESNSKLGIPTTYWGGVPIFKDIPYFRPWVPLLGWFVRHAGHDAASQQSIIFGQTTIYPTIGDLLPLLTSTANTEGN